MMNNRHMTASASSRIRTTVTLDNDAYEIASHYAKANDITLGKALSNLTREAVSMPRRVPRVRIMPDGLPSLPARGKRITPELVKDILEEEFE
jgi:hypothetical protein